MGALVLNINRKMPFYRSESRFFVVRQCLHIFE